MEIDDVRNKEADDLTDDEKTFLSEKWDELDEDEQNVFGDYVEHEEEKEAKQEEKEQEEEQPPNRVSHM